MITIDKIANSPWVRSLTAYERKPGSLLQSGQRTRNHTGNTDGGGGIEVMLAGQISCPWRSCMLRTTDPVLRPDRVEPGSIWRVALGTPMALYDDDGLNGMCVSVFFWSYAIAYMF